MKNLTKGLIGLGVIVIVGLGVVGISKAASLVANYQPKVIVMGNYIEAAGTQAATVVSSAGTAVKEAVLGSVQTVASHLVDTGSLTNMGSLYLYDNQTGGGLEVAGTAYFNGAISTVGTSTLGGIVSVDVNGTFADATTTLGCASNPFGTTSTARYAAATDTGIATTSFALTVATSTQLTGLTTSTPGFGVGSPAQLLNVNLLAKTTVTGTRFSGSAIADSRSNQTTSTAGSINVAPNEAVCFVAGEGNGGNTTGVTNPNNLFAGTYDVEFKR